MNKIFFRFVSLIIVFIYCINTSACFAFQETNLPIIKTVKIPDVKTLIISKGLIPKVEYEYNNGYTCDSVIRTEPAIGSEVEEDTSVTLYVCKGPAYYVLSDSVGRMWNIDGIEDFIWQSEANDGHGTKGFSDVWVENGYLNVNMYLGCKSEYDIEFYGDFGIASINDTFDKTVPIKVLYTSKKVDNNGSLTGFGVKIPLNDLGVQKPTNINIEIDFLVNKERKPFRASFDLSW